MLINVNNSEWRIWAKIVAVVDLISSILRLIVTLCITFLAGAATTVIVNSTSYLDNGIEESQEAVVITWIIWIAIAIMLISTFIGLWAAVRLFKATELGRDAKVAHKFCESWRLVCLIFTALTLISNLMISAYIMLAIDLFTRGIFIYVVHRYMHDLRAVAIDMPYHMKQSQIVEKY